MPNAGELKVEIRAGVGKFKQDLAAARAVALREAAEIERSIEGRLQTKLTRGEQFRNRVVDGTRSGIRGVGAFAAGSAAVGAAAFGAFRVGNSIEAFLNNRAALEEEDRLRRESQTLQIQQNFIRQQAAGNVNRTSIGSIRESFRQRRAAAIGAATGDALGVIQQDATALQGIVGGFRRPTSVFSSIRFFQNQAFSKADIALAESQGLSLNDARQQRILNERQGVLNSEIRAINEEERQALEAEIRSKFSSFDAPRRLQERRELIEALRTINSSVQSTQPTGSRAN